MKFQELCLTDNILHSKEGYTRISSNDKKKKKKGARSTGCTERLNIRDKRHRLLPLGLERNIKLLRAKHKNSYPWIPIHYRKVS